MVGLDAAALPVIVVSRAADFWDGSSAPLDHRRARERLRMVALNRTIVRFSLGRLLMTPGAIDAMARSGDSPLTFLRRHAAGDWGDVCASDAKRNNAAVRDGSRILSAYSTSADEKLWIITEAEPREATTILLPSEY